MLSGSGSPCRRSSLSSATLRFSNAALFRCYQWADPLALPGQDVTQQTMGQSINNFCPTVNSIASPTPGQANLGNLCTSMLRNSFGLDMSGLNGALSQLNGGAELSVPTGQASIVQTTQTSRQTSAIEARLSQLRDWPAGTAVAGARFPQTGQVAALNTQDPAGQILLAQDSSSRIYLFERSVWRLGQWVWSIRQQGPDNERERILL